jgi:hypothetical protein
MVLSVRSGATHVGEFGLRRFSTDSCVCEFCTITANCRAECVAGHLRYGAHRFTVLESEPVSRLFVEVVQPVSDRGERRRAGQHRAARDGEKSGEG